METETKGLVLRLRLMDKSLDGRIRCGHQSSSSIAYKIPRTMLNKCNDNDDFEKAGIYFLFGTDENDYPTVYVGQASERKNGKGGMQRISEHLKDKNYWKEVIFITHANNILGSTQLCYLENFFYNQTKQAKRYIVLNKVEPVSGNPSEDDILELEDFIYCSKIMIGILGHKVFEKLSESYPKKSVLKIETKSGRGKGYRTSDGFVLLEGSVINGSMVKSCPYNVVILREKYKDKINNKNTTTEDILFSSPSAAACFVTGNSTNGYAAWKDSSNRTLKEIEEEYNKQT